MADEDYGTPFLRAEEVDETDRPDWWRRNAAEFEAHDLPDYRPPRFADGVLVPPVVEHLERVYGVEVALRGFDATTGSDWSVLVDGQAVAEVGHRRSTDRHSVFEVDAESFVATVAAAVEGK